MKMQKYQPDSENNLESTGFDMSTFDSITEAEIRDYFTPESFDAMFGRDWGFAIDHRNAASDNEEEVDFDFESYIAAAIDQCDEIGKLSK